jgi:hypothetical protein
MKTLLSSGILRCTHSLIAKATDKTAIDSDWSVNERIIPYDTNGEKRKEKSLWQ